MVSRRAGFVCATFTNGSFTVVQEEGKSLIFDRSVPDVRQPIVVHIAEIDAHAGQMVAILVVATPACRPTSSNFFRQVVEQKVGAVIVGDEDVEKAVVVIIGKGDAHALALYAAIPVSVGNIRERPVAVVADKVLGSGPKLSGMAISAAVETHTTGS